MSFQNYININAGYSTDGNFATVNPKINTVSPLASFNVGLDGIYVGRFVWIDTVYLSLVNNFGNGKPLGFVPNERKGDVGITENATLQYKIGIQVSVFDKGDFFARNIYKDSNIGEKVFANLTDGTFTTDVTGTVIPGYIETDFAVIVSANQNELAVISNILYSTSTPIVSGFRITDADERRLTDIGDFRVTD